MNGSSVALRCELRVAPSSSHRLRAAPRIVVLTSAQAVKEDKATEPIVRDVQETLSEDAVLRVVAKKTKQRELLTGFESQTLVAALIRDVPSTKSVQQSVVRDGKTDRRAGGHAPLTRS